MRLIDAEEVIEYLTAVKAELGAERVAMTGWGVPAKARQGRRALHIGGEENESQYSWNGIYH